MNVELAALKHPGSAYIALDFHTGGIDLPHRDPQPGRRGPFSLFLPFLKEAQDA
ncbi:hypothetical protein J2789_006822 [Variovorax paradoxus]|uniref:hypothetical protein n=1 Tax=Variovorax atrisoli TaxID=3394203 RepID=UPI00119C7930|nr:hypothetical protein [Variovorax paradoxus]MDR6524119.1 hypothetical protein [Variovorax paradoxus]